MLLSGSVFLCRKYDVMAKRRLIPKSRITDNVELDSVKREVAGI